MTSHFSPPHLRKVPLPSRSLEFRVKDTVMRTFCSGLYNFKINGIVPQVYWSLIWIIIYAYLIVRLFFVSHSESAVFPLSSVPSPTSQEHHLAWWAIGLGALFLLFPLSQLPLFFCADPRKTIGRYKSDCTCSGGFLARSIGHTVRARLKHCVYWACPLCRPAHKNCTK